MEKMSAHSPEEVECVVEEVILDQLEPDSGMVSSDDKFVDSEDIVDGNSKGMLGMEPIDLLAVQFKLRKQLGLKNVDPQRAMAFMFAGSESATVARARDLGYFGDAVKVEGGAEGQEGLQVVGSKEVLEEVAGSEPLTVRRLQELIVRELRRQCGE